MSVKTLDDLFRAQLKDIYYAENQLFNKGLPEMAETATDEDLVAAFEEHREETQDQIDKLEQVFALLDMDPEGEKCEAIEGLLKEAKHIIKETKDDETINAALIAAGQKVEHYEIATYGCLCAFAKRLGYDDAAEILHSILEQEKSADEKLTDLAYSGINDMAAAA